MGIEPQIPDASCHPPSSIPDEPVKTYHRQSSNDGSDRGVSLVFMAFTEKPLHAGYERDPETITGKCDQVCQILKKKEQKHKYIPEILFV